MNKKALILILTVAAIIAGILIMADEQEPTTPAGFLDETESIVTEEADIDELDLEVSVALPDAPEFMNIEGYDGAAVLDTSYKHTSPGKFSEIFVTGSGFVPGEKTIVYLKKTGSDEYEPGGHEVFPDENGNIDTSFTIYSYGSYDVELFYSQKGNFVDTVVVE